MEEETTAKDKKVANEQGEDEVAGLEHSEYVQRCSASQSTIEIRTDTGHLCYQSLIITLSEVEEWTHPLAGWEKSVPQEERKRPGGD